jgi:hypothetical protein
MNALSRERSKVSLHVLNAADATFECTFGRGCEGDCCKNGRPVLYPDEIERLDANLEKILSELLPAAREIVKAHGYRSARTSARLPLARVVNGWCVFFNEGCSLHRLGEAEGDKFRYKPAACALFPLDMDEHDQWYFRQWGYKREKWDLFCLNPANTTIKAADSCQGEMALAAHFDAEYEARMKRAAEKGS